MGRWMHAVGILLLVLSISSVADEKFQSKLNLMLQRTEQSTKLLRKQITESQSAPFLPDLYLQLAELLSERSNTLYYIQMERQAKDGLPADKTLSPVVAAQQEAISVYQLLLKDFPTFDKRKVTLYRMALAQKSIDDSTGFTKTCGLLMKDYPNSEEATGASLLVAQSYFDRADYKAASDLLIPITKSNFIYERNLAKYRLGLIDIATEHWNEALTRFEDVILDSELKSRNNPYDVSYKAHKVKSDLKREALIDSIRAYTHVYSQKQTDPVTYYSKLAPTEIHFQEVIEKLSLRFISLKKYSEALKLLRTLSERTSDPQKVINIYQEVLLTIPVKDRTGLPSDEIKFLLDKYNLWASYYQLPSGVTRSSYSFFEKQVRDLGTTSHLIAKSEGASSKSWARARDFYLLYLGYFRKTKNAAKMAANLGDVYFAMQDYLKSGEYYLRTFSGEFGQAADKKALIENALLCLQKKKDYAFYDRLRLRGLIIRAAESFMKFDPKMKKDPALNFLLVKMEYEQNFFPSAIGKLYAFIRNFKKEKQAVDAAEMLLDYYNTKNDFKAIEGWSKRLMALKIPDKSFNQKLQRIEKQAKSKVIYEKVRSLAGYDDFAQGKSYLTAAMSSDSSIKNIALNEALSKSRAEGDYQTFLQAATLMAKKETNRDKKFEILMSVARERTKITEYYVAFKGYVEVAHENSLTNQNRIQAVEEAINLALILRDWDMLKQILHEQVAKEISKTTKIRCRDQLTDLIDSPAFRSDLASEVLSLEPNDATLLALYKAQFHLDAKMQTEVIQEVTKLCNSDPKKAVCLWGQVGLIDRKKDAFVQKLKTLQSSLQAIQASAEEFMQLSGSYRALEGSQDILLESVVALRNAELFVKYGTFLETAASKNAELKPVLSEKAQETFRSAKTYQESCKEAAHKSLAFRKVGNYCMSPQGSTLKELLDWQRMLPSPKLSTDPQDSQFKALKKKVFSSKEDMEPLLELAKVYLDGKYYQHAAAAASYGIAKASVHEKDFRAILGCSVMQLGFFAEANYHFQSASPYEGLAERCKKSLPQ